MNRLIGLMAIVLTCAACVGPDSGGGGYGGQESVGEEQQAVVSAKRAGGIWAHPESCAWHPLLQRFLCTNAVIGSTVSFHDNVGWIGQISKTGQALWPLDGGGVGPGTPPGWGDMSNSWYDQWGASELGNPLGIAVNPVNGNIYVAEGGKLDFGGGAQPSICVYNQSGVFLHRLMMPGILTINDLTWYGNALYVTDSAFSSANLSALWKVLQPDNPAAVPQNWLALPNYPRPNAIVYRNFDAGAGLRPHFFISTLGTNLGSQDVHNGGVIRVDVISRTVTGLGPFNLFSDGIAWQRTQIGPGRLLVSDLSTKRIFTMNPLTGATALWLDVSTEVEQLAGMGCDESVPSVCASATLRGEVLILNQ